MKKTLILFAFTFISLSVMSQNIEFGLSGGVNFQRSSSAESDFSFLSHFGVMAGVRISYVGIYGEVLYSTHDDENWLETGSYLVPSVFLRFYRLRNLYVEAGLSYYVLAEDQVGMSMYEFPDKQLGYFAGMGLNIRNFEVGLRTTGPVMSIQATASIRFSL